MGLPNSAPMLIPPAKGFGGRALHSSAKTLLPNALPRLSSQPRRLLPLLPLPPTTPGDLGPHPTCPAYYPGTLAPRPSPTALARARLPSSHEDHLSARLHLPFSSDPNSRVKTVPPPACHKATGLRRVGGAAHRRSPLLPTLCRHPLGTQTPATSTPHRDPSFTSTTRPVRPMPQVALSNFKPRLLKITPSHPLPSCNV